MHDSAAPKNRQSFNPFIYNVPVRGIDFCNRETTIDKILHETVTGRTQGNVWITGERQVGKSSLLRYIQSKYENFDEKVRLYPDTDLYDVSFIYVNIQDGRNRDDFYRLLRQGLKNLFDFKIDVKDNAYESFIDALKYVYLQKNYVVFLVDEFDAFIQHLAATETEPATIFLAELNKLIQGISEIKNEPKVFSCIFAANRSIEELVTAKGIDLRGSGLVLENTQLEWFTPQQVRELAWHYLSDNVIWFEEDDIDICFKMTQGYPYFVQKFFSILYTEKSQNPDNYLAEVKKKYGNAFKETIEGWKANMPGRTLGKLKDLAGGLLKEVSDKSVSLAFKILEEAFKNQ
ncbi:MAG: ATP-binding protein [bacterium]|nr:ATP-binding protein [bacterium]